MVTLVVERDCAACSCSIYSPTGEFMPACADCVVDASIFRGSLGWIHEGLEWVLEKRSADHARIGEVEALRAYVARRLTEMQGQLTSLRLVIHDWGNMPRAERTQAFADLRELAETYSKTDHRRGRALNIIASYFHFLTEGS